MLQYELLTLRSELAETNRQFIDTLKAYQASDVHSERYSNISRSLGNLKHRLELLNRCIPGWNYPEVDNANRNRNRQGKFSK